MIHFNDDIENCLQVLNNGGLILYPTDTIWGLGCDATNEDAVAKLTGLKGKPSQKGLIVLLASERDVLQYVAAPDLQVFDYLRTRPKPTTVVYDHGLGVAPNVLNQDGSIAIRLVQHEFCRHLLKRFRKPIISTSANLHGQSSPQNFFEIDQRVKQMVDYVAFSGRDDVFGQQSSSIIRWKSPEEIIVIRE